MDVSSCISSAANNVYENISTASQHNHYPAREVINRQHDIFLSHSGKQKGFVKNLYDMLSPCYFTFFDICHHSLPLAERFPDHIFYAAKTCKLAIVVLSNDFVRSKWPMMELCAFLEAQSVKILPLFYKVSSGDLKDEDKLKEWMKEWEIYAKKDTSGRVNVHLWKNALKTLCSYEGLVFKKAEGEQAYLQEIISFTLREVLPQVGKYEQSGIWGMDRLCKVIVSKFEYLEFQQSKLPSPQGKVCVLGIYGPSGIGKSTISQFIHEKEQINFKGKTLRLELPTNPRTADLIEYCKKLLQHMTNQFYTHAQLEMASNNLQQMYYLFRSSNIRRSKVFLVIDNISTDITSIELVRATLQMCVGPGSKVLLVARAYNTLRMCQEKLDEYYVCHIIRVPGLTVKEAIKVLLQPGGGVGLDDEPEKNLTPRDQEVVEKVVRMCGYVEPEQPETEVLYLPLVFKMIGHRLRESRLEWGIELQSILAIVEACKKIVVTEIWQKSFDRLSPKLQLLFLDLALFYLPMHGRCIEDACAFLSLMEHGCSPEEIKLQMYGLDRSCFLSIVHDKWFRGINIHHMFLAFASSIPESSMYFWSRGHDTHGKDAAVVPRYQHSLLVELQAKCRLRVIVLELGEECDRFDFPAGFSSVKILNVRNSKSLRVLGLVGLTALVSLEIVNCPSLTWVQLADGNDHNHLHSLRRLSWSNTQENISVVMPQNRLGMLWQNLLQKTRCLYQENISVVMPQNRLGMLWQNLLQNTRCLYRMMIEGGRPSWGMIGVVGIASQVRCLQVLRLENTGIRRLGDMSRCWPQLKELEIIENQLEHLEVGNLPELKRFCFSECGRYCILHLPLSGDEFFGDVSRLAVKGGVPIFGDDSRMLMSRNNLLAQCPELEDVRIASSAFDEGVGMLGMLTTTKLHTLLIVEVEVKEQRKTKVLNLTSPSPWHFVSDCRDQLRCQLGDQLTSLNTGCQLGDLRQLSLSDCPCLAGVLGLHGLHDLQKLYISQCVNLTGVHGFEGLTSLQELRIRDCSNLRNLSGLSGLARLEVFGVWGCSRLEVMFSDLEDLTNLTGVECEHFVPDPLGSSVNVQNLVSMELLNMGIEHATLMMVKGLEKLGRLRDLNICCRHHEVNQVTERHINETLIVDLAMLLGVPKPVVVASPQYLSSCFPSITWLKLDGLKNLSNLNGIEFLPNLQSLELLNLQNLACLRGIEVLIHVDFLNIKSCPSVVDLPSLSTLVNMRYLVFEDCVDLRAVEGCDAMKRLRRATFVGCKSLASLPVMDRNTLQKTTAHRFFPSSMSERTAPGPVEIHMDRYCISLDIKGSMFASVEMTELWVMDEEVPAVLRGASLTALGWELTTNLRERPRERQELCARLLKTVGAYLLERSIINKYQYEDHQLVLGEWADWIEKEERERVVIEEEAYSLPLWAFLVNFQLVPHECAKTRTKILATLLRAHANHVTLHQFKSDFGLQMQCLAALEIL